MQEYVANAIVLRKDSLRDLDGRYSFFTDRFGKIIGKATSSRKIVSKLAPHLEPGIVSRVRYVEKGGTQIVDALKIGRAGNINFLDLHFLAELLPEGQPESELWGMIVDGTFSWPDALALLGWDPTGAHCATCGRASEAFYTRRQEFFCRTCAARLPRDAVILL
ncbi:MAG TPA: recombination protein O N-terminal domain-containing protein [Candidatus Paceibacterota bacterium]|nr:recombination protein O N-terminal domain-containing protein [Candidatus Paceibacterota bacterium]